jgi:hypothetical protein
LLVHVGTNAAALDARLFGPSEGNPTGWGSSPRRFWLPSFHWARLSELLPGQRPSSYGDCGRELAYGRSRGCVALSGVLLLSPTILATREKNHLFKTKGHKAGPTI